MKWLLIRPSKLWCQSQNHFIFQISQSGIFHVIGKDLRLSAQLLCTGYLPESSVVEEYMNKKNRIIYRDLLHFL